MSAHQAEPENTPAVGDPDVDDVIAMCDGDARAAISVLLVANSFLEAEVERLRGAISLGYVRGMLGDDTPLAKLWRGC